MKRSPLTRKTPLQRKPWRKALGSPEQRLSFKRRVHELDGGNCVMVGRSLCEGDLHAAHVIPKRRLREMGFGAEVVYDPASAMSLCFRHHNRHDMALEKVPYSYVPQRCKVFVQALNLAHVLKETAA